MGISCSTPASSSISPTGSFEMSPYTPTSVISSPTILPVLKPRPWSLSSTAATSSRVASRRILRSEEHTSELQSPCNLVCRLLLEKKKKKEIHITKLTLTQGHINQQSRQHLIVAVA